MSLPLVQVERLEELHLAGSLDDDTLAGLRRLRCVPGLRVLDLERCEGVPASYRWRHEGEEVAWVLDRLTSSLPSPVPAAIARRFGPTR